MEIDTSMQEITGVGGLVRSCDQHVIERTDTANICRAEELKQ